MKYISAILIIVGIVFLSVSGATATSYTFDAGVINGLEHKYYYTWGLDWSVPDGEKIVGASLFFNDIRNWNSGENDLYVHLLDSAILGKRRYWDGQGQGDNFANMGILLNHWHNLPATPQDITYNLDSSEIGTLMAYVVDGNFGLGFDPDCHFYNNGISFTIETAATPIPAPILLLGTGLIGLVGFRRAPRKK
jgi:hypothetical protein